jgi:hypothetical protein
VCYVLSRDNFMLILGGMDKITQTLAQQMRIRILKSVPLLAMLTDDELIQVPGIPGPTQHDLKCGLINAPITINVPTMYAVLSFFFR